MKRNSNEMSTGAAFLLTIGIMLFIGMIISASEPKCRMSGCDRDAREGESYCYLHEMSYRSYGNPDYNAVYKQSQENRDTYSSGSSTKSDKSNNTTSNKTNTSNKSSTSKKKDTSGSSNKYSGYSAYDEGYEDVYENDDYDWDRYWSDSDYADGVDDAMEDAEW